MRTLRFALGVAACCGALLVGCDDGRSIDDFQVSVRPVPLEGALLYAHRTDNGGRALIVDVTGSKPAITAYDLPPGDVKSYSRPGSQGREVVVLTQGTSLERAREERGTTGSAVLVFDREGETFRKELEGRFTDLTLSPDGRVAVAHGHGQDTGVDVGNTVAIVDLDTGMTRNIALSDNTGRAAESFAFPEPNDGSRRLMLARGVDTLSLLELDHLERKPKEIPIKLASDPRTLRPGKIIFRFNEIFVQLQNSSDVLVLQLVPEAGEDAFRVTPLYLTTGSTVEDIELVKEQSPDRRLVVLGQGKVSVVDPVTGNVTSSNADSAYADLLRYEGPSPVDAEIRERGLLLPAKGSRIAFVDFADGTSWSEQSVEALALPDSLERVIPLAQHRLVVLGYTGGAMGLVDLDSRKVTPINTGSIVSSVVVDESAGQARLWLSLANNHVARIDLLQLESRELLLDTPTDALVLIEGAPRQLAALHNAKGGFITLLDPENPSLGSIREMASFFYTDILD